MNKNNFLILILAFGTFSILTTEMGFIGILPLLSSHFNVSITDAGLFVSLFAIGVAIAGPIMPLLFSKIDYKKSLLLVLAIFVISNVLLVFTTDFKIALILRVFPAFFHPIFCSFALTLAVDLVEPEESLKAVSKVIMGVSAGMILGVPIANFFAFNFSYEASIIFMAIINLISFIGLAILMPSMSPKVISYGSQVKILKKPVLILSIIGVIFLTAGIQSVYSYISVYLTSVGDITGILLTIALFLYGVASLCGNHLGGKLLSKVPIKTVFIFPFVLSGVYLLIFGLNQYAYILLAIVLIWGLLAGLGNNIQQYWIVSVAPEAPEFANGIFLSSGNVGVAMGTSLSSFIIGSFGVEYILFGGILSLIIMFVFVVFRNRINVLNV